MSKKQKQAPKSQPEPEQVHWSPKLSKKQAELVNCDKRFILAHGARGTGKTRAVIHRLAQLLWHYDNRIIVFAKTVKSAAMAGSWRELTEEVIPEWINSGIGMEWAWEPKTDGSTRTHSFAVRNYNGGISECYLFSVDHDQEVEAKVKNLVAGGIYFIELSNFKDKIVFDATIPQLRLASVPFDKQVWIADTNPDEEGTDSWIYKLWFEKNYFADGVAETLDQEYKDELSKLLDESLHEMFFEMADNPFMDQRQFKLWEANYASDVDQHNRYTRGLWIKRPKKSAHFRDVFKKPTHVVGNADGQEERWEVPLPSVNCVELLTGWDLGDRFHSFHLVEKVFTESGASYVVLDELYNNGEELSVAEFTESVMELLEKYESYIWRNYNRQVRYRHWSDAAANTNYKAAAGAHESNIVLNASGGKLVLLSSPKGAGSVKRRVDITKTLLHEERLFIGANCKGTIDMLENTSKGKSQLYYVERDKYKHRFDSLSYIFGAEEPIDIANKIHGRIGKRSKMVAVNL